MVMVLCAIIFCVQDSYSQLSDDNILMASTSKSCLKVLNSFDTPFCYPILGESYSSWSSWFFNNASTLSDVRRNIQLLDGEAKFRFESSFLPLLTALNCTSDSCKQQFLEQVCKFKFPFCCSGMAATNYPSVCNGRGFCLGIDNCNCYSNTTNWGGSSCSTPKCSGILATNSSVCSSSGYCASPNVCLAKCFGVDPTNSSICSGRGDCVSQNVCSCSNSFSGELCEKQSCSLNTDCLSNNCTSSIHSVTGVSYKWCGASSNVDINTNSSINNNNTTNQNSSISNNNTITGNGTTDNNTTSSVNSTNSDNTQGKNSTIVAFDCSGVSNCSGNGNCVSENVCECFSGYIFRNCSGMNGSSSGLNITSGLNTSSILNNTSLNNNTLPMTCNLNCGKFGVCMNESGTALCVCKENFVGILCDQCDKNMTLFNETCVKLEVVCSLNCGLHGNCVKTESTQTCNCTDGYITLNPSQPCQSCPIQFIENPTKTGCICGVGSFLSQDKKSCICDESSGFTTDPKDAGCICNTFKGFSSLDKKCHCDESANYFNNNGSCIRMDPGCDLCDNGQCVYIDQFTNITTCKCNVGYVDGDFPCSACTSGFNLENGKCVRVCPQNYGGPDCADYIPPNNCIPIPTTALNFCKSFVSYSVESPKYISEAMNQSHASQLLVNKLHIQDHTASLKYQSILKEVSNQSLTCDQACRDGIAKILCFTEITPCILVNDLPTPRELCQATCELISDLEIKNQTTSLNNICNGLNNRALCFESTYLPLNTSCYGIFFSNKSVCSSRGKCSGTDLCECQTGYSGPKCEFKICFSKSSNDSGVCSGFGECVSVDNCVCNNGRTGFDCSVPTCNGITERDGGCSNQGICSNEGICICKGNFEGISCSECKPGFVGPDCEVPVCNGIIASDSSVCSGRGKCQSEGGKPTCSCSSGYYGINCQDFSCSGLDKSNTSVCSGKGKCVDVDTCVCRGNFDPDLNCGKCLPNYNGNTCLNKTCSNELTCNSHGVCSSDLKCVCSGNWNGTFCDECIDGYVGPMCNIVCSVQMCNYRGSCQADGSCSCNGNMEGQYCEKCKSGWSGPNCDYKIVTDSFGFSEYGDYIIGTIYSIFKRGVDCRDILSNSEILGLNPQCLFSGDNDFLKIRLGINSAIKFGDVLKLRSIVGNLNASTIVEVIVKTGSFVSTSPKAVISMSKSTASRNCDKMVLDGTQSSSLDRKQLQYSWSTSMAPSQMDLENMESLLVGSLPTLSFSTASLSVGLYTVQLLVQSSLSGEKASDSVTFFITESALPTVTIKEGQESIYTIGSIATITPIISFPSCYSGYGTVQYSYSQDSSKSAVPVNIYKDRNMLLLGNDFTKLSKEGDYTFSLAVSQPGAGTSTISFKISAKAAPLKVGFSVADFQQSYEDNVRFTILPQDPSNITQPEQVKLSCLNIDTSSNCAGFTNGIIGDLNFNQKMNAGKYLFTVEYAKGTRTVRSNLKVVLLETSKNSVIRMSVTPKRQDPSREVDLSAIDSNTDLILVATPLDSLNGTKTYKWSSVDMDLDSSIISNKTFIVIPKNKLVSASSFTVKVSVSDKTRKGEGVIQFTCNSPPSVGSLTASPSTGMAVKDDFLISCGNDWVDSHLPLTFQFLYKLKEESTWKVLREVSETRSFTTSLPAGLLDIKSLVYDSYGSMSENQIQVNVTLPKDEEVVLQLVAPTNSTPTISSLASVLSLASSATVSSVVNKQKLIDASSNWVSIVFNELAKADIISSISKGPVIAKLSVVSAVSSSLNIVSKETVSSTIGIMLNTLQKSSSNGIMLSSEELTTSKETVNTFNTYVSSNIGSKRFSNQDLQNIQSLYNIILENQVSLNAPDMAAVRSEGVGMTRLYSRLLLVSSLDGLSETIDGENMFELASNISSSSKLSDFDSVNLQFNVRESVSGISAISKTIQLVFANNKQPVSVSSTSPLALISMKRTSQIRRRSLLKSTAVVCFEQSITTLDFNVSTSCQVISSDENYSMIYVKQSGTYAVGIITLEDVITPKVSTIVQPKTSLTAQKSIKLSGATKIWNGCLLFTLFITFCLLSV